MPAASVRPVLPQVIFALCLLVSNPAHGNAVTEADPTTPWEPASRVQHGAQLHGDCQGQPAACSGRLSQSRRLQASAASGSAGALPAASKPRAFKAVAASPSSQAPFPWGAASAAYQAEGGVREGGRGVSIWDVFAHTPNRTHNGENADVTCDFYHNWQGDIALAAQLGMQFFRMSLAWPRILPDGRGRVNQAGIDFYNSVFDALLAAGIEPFVTLYHWDLPQALMGEYGGWPSQRIISDYEEYARVAFQAFGDRVKYWATFNEPIIFCWHGYSDGVHAPGWCSKHSHWCPGGGKGNTTIEPYACMHNVLISHGHAVKAFRTLVPDGKIGMVLNTHWAEPLYDDEVDKAAALNYVEYQLALFADPLFFGDWRKTWAVERKGRWNRAIRMQLTMTAEEAALVKGSVDYFGLNHYTTKYLSKKPPFESFERKGVPIGPVGGSPWLHVVPKGFGKLLRWVHARYQPRELYITENGCDAPGEHAMAPEQAAKDAFRVNYLKSYLAEAVKAAEDGVNIKGYMVWSFTDNFEWSEGYQARFGIIHVDYRTQKRTLKDSARWLAKYFGTAKDVNVQT